MTSTSESNPSNAEQSHQQQQHDEAELKSRVKGLSERRATMEAEVAAAWQQLKATSIGMKEPLVDAEGFPRDDIDLYAVRTARHTIICRTNDLKAVMKEIEAAIGELHAATRSQNEALLEEQARERDRNADAKAQDKSKKSAGVDEKISAEQRKKKHLAELPPFLRVLDVAAEGPAAECGLCPGDGVVSFGPLEKPSFSGALTDLAGVVKENEGRIVEIWVLREGQQDVICCALVPQRWKGQGLVGCGFGTM